MTHIKASTAQISENSAKFLAIPPWGQLCAPRRNQNRIRARLRGEMVKKKNVRAMCDVDARCVQPGLGHSKNRLENQKDFKEEPQE